MDAKELGEQNADGPQEVTWLSAQGAVTSIVRQGWTKRERFAAMAMQGLLSAPPVESDYSVARWAVEHADSLLRELAKDEP